MTIIRPNSISGITSLTALDGSIDFYKVDGQLAGLTLGGVNFNATSGVSTFSSLQVTDIDSVGLITARSGVVLTGGDVTLGTGVTASGSTANTFTLSTNGSERLNIDSDGDINIDSGGVFYDATNNRLAIGVTGPGALLDARGAVRLGNQGNGDATTTISAKMRMEIKINGCIM